MSKNIIIVRSIEDFLKVGRGEKFSLNGISRFMGYEQPPLREKKVKTYILTDQYAWEDTFALEGEIWYLPIERRAHRYSTNEYFTLRNKHPAERIILQLERIRLPTTIS